MRSSFVNKDSKTVWNTNLQLLQLVFNGYAPAIQREGLILNYNPGEVDSSILFFMSDGHQDDGGDVFESENYFQAPNGSDLTPWTSTRYVQGRWVDGDQLRWYRKIRIIQELSVGSINLGIPQVKVYMSIQNVTGDSNIQPYPHPVAIYGVYLYRAFSLATPAHYGRTTESAFAWPKTAGPGMMITHLPIVSATKIGGHPQQKYHQNIGDSRYGYGGNSGTYNDQDAAAELFCEFGTLQPGDFREMVAYYRLM